MGSNNQCINFNLEIDSTRNLGRNFGQQSNPNLIPLGSNQHLFRCGNNYGRDSEKSILDVDGLVNGPMEMVLEEETDLIVVVEGKKRQRIVSGPIVPLGLDADSGSHGLTASSGE
ncbi:hypothetical protein J1N35_005046 [Gossypium stocksii]|uniref:Uncharacterized protein n=1 Tax=Gossypium stocksii TaxID=47602 RepID=A0A9D3WD39_9ROSI|nr:hypothetical protein J1N35_005046 [Gossypium stocksii]